eukprot:COSAG02_NODE_45316_length_358_cov_0.845560_1_plen_119_part_11
MMYGLGDGCKLTVDKDGEVEDLDFHLASFLTLRGPFAWLGWACKCRGKPYFVSFVSLIHFVECCCGKGVGCSGSRGPGEPIKNVSTTVPCRVREHDFVAQLLISALMMSGRSACRRRNE